MTEPRGWTLAVSASSGVYDCILVAPGAGDHHREQGDRELTAVVARLCAAGGCAPRDLARIVLDLGPGSYTGLRVAVTFARTLCHFATARVETLTSLELIALRAWETAEAAPSAVLRPVLDAYRGRRHHAALRRTADRRVELVEQPAATEAERLVESMRPGDVIVAERKLVAELESPAAERGCDLIGFDLRDPRGLAEFLLHPAAAPRPAEPDALEPLYLMGSYAE